LPLVRPETLAAVAASLSDHAVVFPQYRGRRGHPVGFGASCGPALCLLSGSQGAALVARAQGLVHPVAELEIDDVGIVTDIDTPQDLAQAERLLLVKT
jgi:molybdenum cofactor cytidylyltransferase